MYDALTNARKMAEYELKDWTKKSMETKEEPNEYWRCIIGPVKRSELPHGADYPLRWEVQKKFAQMFGHCEKLCYSGWGLTEKEREWIEKLLMFGVTKNGKIRNPKNDKEATKFYDLARKEAGLFK